MQESASVRTEEAVDGPPPGKYSSPETFEVQRPRNAREYRSCAYSLADGYRPLELDVFVPAGAGDDPVAAVVWIHGGGYLSGSRQHPPLEWPAGVLFQRIIDAGIAVVSIDYRHAREAPFPAQLHDAKAAVRYVRAHAWQLGIDPERIAVWGESAGGHLAALLGLVTDDDELEGGDGVIGVSSSVAAVIDFYGIADVETMPKPSEAVPPERLAVLSELGAEIPDPIQILLTGSTLIEKRGLGSASPTNYVRAEAPPFLLVHGTADLIVPSEQSERLASALQEQGVSAELVLVPGGHVFIGGDPLPQIDRGIRFLETIGF
ncbi:alpha/beta hydrolase [Brevibacterium sp.]|uniref:alpha/beta hydrolase n=1 Tax=Brevibacterium sp. TaxID=1701 RepID=UPI002811EFEB|nr:alpha/beta hydrolase [Brevibacterium sp.]